jgi:hypothetical protein
VRDRLGRHGHYSSQVATAMWRDVAYWPKEADLGHFSGDIRFRG